MYNFLVFCFINICHVELMKLINEVYRIINDNRFADEKK